MQIQEAVPSRVDRQVLGKGVDDFSEAISKVRNAVVMAIGCVKELKSQAVEKYSAPGMRIIIGHILDLLGQVQTATRVTPADINVQFL